MRSGQFIENSGEKCEILFLVDVVFYFPFIYIGERKHVQHVISH